MVIAKRLLMPHTCAAQCWGRNSTTKRDEILHCIRYSKPKQFERTPCEHQSGQFITAQALSTMDFKCFLKVSVSKGSESDSERAEVSWDMAEGAGNTIGSSEDMSDPLPAPTKFQERRNISLNPKTALVEPLLSLRKRSPARLKRSAEERTSLSSRTSDLSD